MKKQAEYVIFCIFDNFLLASIEPAKYQKDTDICLIALDKFYIPFQYLFGIRMCSVLAKCWKSSEIAKIAYFLLILLNLSPNKSPFNQYYPKSVPDSAILIILLSKNDKIVVLVAKFLFWLFFLIGYIKMHWLGRLSTSDIFQTLLPSHVKSLFCNLHEVSYKMWIDKPISKGAIFGP